MTISLLNLGNRFYANGLHEVQMELIEEAEDHVVGSKVQDGEDDEKKDVELKLSLRVSCLSNKNRENRVIPDPYPHQETSSSDILIAAGGSKPDMRGDNIMKTVIEPDHDVNPTGPAKTEGSFLASWTYKIINKLLDNVGTPLRLQCIGLYLMMAEAPEIEQPPQGYADLEKDGLGDVKPGLDSGISSTASEGPKSAERGQSLDVKYVESHTIKEEEDLEDGGKKDGRMPASPVDEHARRKGQDQQMPREGEQGSQDRAGRQDGETPTCSTSGIGQVRAQTYFRTPGHHRSGLAGIAGMVHRAFPSTSLGKESQGFVHHRAVLSQQSAANQPPVVSIEQTLRSLRFQGSIQQNVYKDIRCGSKDDLHRYVQNIGKAEINTGVFLAEYKCLLGLRDTDNVWTEGKDFIQLRPLQQGKEVFLCQSTISKQHFVTKHIPLIYEDIRRGEHGPSMGKYGLQRPQQVDLVVDHQDSCPWKGLAFIYGLVKRKLKGKEVGEIFMEYCEDETIFHNIKTLTAKDINAQVQMAREFLDIAVYLHERDIIHGDFKLENIGMRKNGLAVIDFEAAKHPRYKLNWKGTLQYVPPWFQQFHPAGGFTREEDQFNLLKTWDMWDVGMILLKIRCNQLMFGREWARVRRCNSCDGIGASCKHSMPKFLELIDNNYDDAKAYLPRISLRDGPVETRMAFLIHGLLAAHSPWAQLTAAEARDVLDEENIMVVFLKNGCQTVRPLVVKKGTKLKNCLHLPSIEKLKILYDDLCDGMWFTREVETPHGYRWMNVDLHQELTDCCVLRVYPV